MTIRIAKTYDCLGEWDMGVKDFFIEELRRRQVVGGQERIKNRQKLVKYSEDELMVFVARLTAKNDLVVHDPYKFAMQIHNVDPRGENTSPKLEKLRREEIAIEKMINFLLFRVKRDACFDLHPIQREHNFRYKDTLADVLQRIKIPMPKTVPLAEFRKDFFPVYVKRVDRHSGRGIEFCRDESSLVMPEEKEQGLYIVQEAFNPPTRFPSNIRVVVYGGHVIGAMIYYNTGPRNVVNESAGCKGIPLTEEMQRPLKDREKAILDAYSLNGELGKILNYARKIGRYTKNFGMPAVALEFVMDRDTRRVGCVDANFLPFGLGIFHVLYRNREPSTPTEQLRKIAGKELAHAYLKDSKR